MKQKSFKTHIYEAHNYWTQSVQPGDTVIDATLGNGYDTYFLATLLQGKGRLVSYDIQKQAIDASENRLSSLAENERKIITLKLKSHIYLEESDVKLIVYNLGYLPGSDKTITTQRTSTIQSLERAVQILKPKGALSITCYPGHEEGRWEQKEVLRFISLLPESKWKFSHHYWVTPHQNLSKEFLAPSLIWLQAVPGA